jgi:PAS domain S-box-containing protein
MKSPQLSVRHEEEYQPAREGIYEKDISRASFDVAGIFMIAVNTYGIIIQTNRKTEYELGYSPGELIGQSFYELLIAPGKRDLIQNEVNSIIQNIARENYESLYPLLTKEGIKITIDARCVGIFDDNDKYKGALITGNKIQDYSQNLENLKTDTNFYQAIANNLPEINIFIFNREMEFILAEGTEMKNLNLIREDFENRKVSQIPLEDLKEIWQPLFKKALKGKHIKAEYNLNNYHYVILISPVMDKNDNIISCVAITRNVTNEKRTERNLKLSKVEAERSNQAKNLFLARVSHEIRTPLNAILGFTEQLKQTELSTTQKNFLDIIDESSEHLLSLINDILVLSKIEANQIRFEKTPFKLNYIIEYVYKSLANKAKEKNLDFHYHIDENLDKVLVGDSFRLQQILINLVNNAIKFTNSGKVVIKCHLKEKKNSTAYVNFDVIDSGIGISKKDIQNIFKEFRQANFDTKKIYGGTGLGLNICKNLIELQKGTLSVTSKVGEGSTFSFSIPYKLGEVSDLVYLESHQIDPDLLKHIKCLLVDDDNVNRLLGKTILEKFNCTFDTARNGEEAIEYLDEKKYDLVLLDIHMPGINGIEVAKHLRKIKNDRETKIIALTAAALKNDILQCFKVGMNDFLIKPFKEINLYSKICEVLNMKVPKAKATRAEIILRNELTPKPYDLSDLRKMSNYNDQLVKNMISTFIENSENALQSFEKNLSEENWKEIGETAHKILPSYRHLAIDKVVQKLVDIKNKTLVKPDYESVPNLANECMQEISTIMIQLKEENSV